MGFETLRTDRLIVRAVRPDDAVALHARRDDPEIAEYQDWNTPFPLDRAHTIVAGMAALDGPTVDKWWMGTIADHDDTIVLGDVVVHLSPDGNTAEIGYTLARDAWGRGYAVEAAAAVVDDLFERLGVTRVEGGLHPDNSASAMVLERVGMLFEGHKKLSYWLGDENSDDWLYGMVRSDWEAWRDRPHNFPASVRLVEITAGTLSQVGKLVTHKSQERFVAPVRASFGDALFPEVVNGEALVPWVRAVEADGVLVGFVMVAVSTPANPEPYLWRLLVDRMHQRRGIGSAVIDLVVEQCKKWDDEALLTSWVPGKGSPEPMYLAHGFVPTGEMVDGEIEGRLVFRDAVDDP